MSRFRIKSSIGFGIIEVLISAFMIATMLGAAVIVANTGVQKANFAQSKLIATNLANQAIEEVVAIRNRAYLDNDATTGFNCTVTFTPGIGCVAGLPNDGDYLLDSNPSIYNDVYIGGRFPGRLLKKSGLDQSEDIYYTINNGVSYVTILGGSPYLAKNIVTTFKRTINIQNIKQKDALLSSGYNVQFNNIDADAVVAKKIHVSITWSEPGLAGSNSARVDQTIILTDWKNGN